MGKKAKFVAPYIGIETVKGIPVFYNRYGDYSCIIRCDNPVLQYAADVDAFYDFHQTYTNIIKILGPGTILQKQDIFAKRIFSQPADSRDDYLNKRYFEHFEGRVYTDITTYLIITGEINKGAFFAYDSKKFDTFIRNISKVLDLFTNKGLNARLLDERELDSYIKRFFSLDFTTAIAALENISVKDEYLQIGKKYVQSISLVDIDEVNFPGQIKPFKEINVGIRFPVDVFSFLHTIPDVDTVVYNQVIIIPDQRGEMNKLEAKKKKHKGIPDPANDLCVEDIERVMADIAREGQLLVYSHNNIILSGHKPLSKAVNFVESSLFDCGIIVSKQCYNQLELFECALPGNAVNLKTYDRFLTTSDAAICLLFKERLKVTEDSPFLTYFTDRQGLPIGIDPSGKEGEVKRTNNANQFVLGPSGSGKSFFMNAMLRQFFLQDTDVVLVDTGHSYSGLCAYYGGKYITYSEEKPITMNPFRIKREEYNEEKLEFLKSLIALLWKGADGEINQVEDTLLNNVLAAYYDSYFSPKEKFALTDDDRERIRTRLTGKWEAEEVHSPETPDGETLEKKIHYEIAEAEREARDRAKYKVKSLSFNTFYDFALREIEESSKKDGIRFDTNDFRFILKKFYKGGKYDKILNDDFDASLFDEPFIVFEIDAIKEHPTLFPITTLVIMDVFLQKMRLKKNRKALIIEEAWKAIASPLMAGYILYLYKTVRKFWGSCLTVTQELEDIIGNKVVKNSIINNSDIICLLDQSKFRDNYDDIANLLSLGEVERKKIFTINNLNNKENRGKFKEVYIKRGSVGEVVGVEVSPHEYFTFTTERIEKDVIEYYQIIYGGFVAGLDHFIDDMKQSGLKQGEYIRQANKVLGKYHGEKRLPELVGRSTDLPDIVKAEFQKLSV